MMTSKHLFPGASHEVVLKENRYGDVSHVPHYLRTAGCSEELENFVMSLLSPDPAERPSAKKALHDPWFEQGLEDGDCNFIPCLKECLLWNEKISQNCTKRKN